MMITDVPRCSPLSPGESPVTHQRPDLSCRADHGLHSSSWDAMLIQALWHSWREGPESPKPTFLSLLGPRVPALPLTVGLQIQPPWPGFW